MNIMPIVKEIKGDLLELFEKGEVRTIAHGANCFRIMGAGIAKQIADKYPEVLRADKESVNNPILKLGRYSMCSVEEGKIYNLYTQLEPGPNFELAALKSALDELSRDVRYYRTTLKLAVPQIGAGIGGGDWDYIKMILDNYDNLLITIVYYDKGQVPMGQTEIDFAS
jgi:O-acetyl-ADP-ribose deacetylase (regulator of RNase III)